MKKEEKDLLLKDLCARLPYGVKLYCTQGTSIDRKKGWKLVGYYEADIEIKDVFGITVGTRHRIILNCIGPNNNIDIDFINDEVKPYLFPLSSMTDEQREEFVKFADYETKLEDCGRHKELYYYDLVGHENNLYPNSDAIDWLNKNHFDYRGLIEKSLALDATNLGIYE